MTYQEFKDAVGDAERTMKMADQAIPTCVSLAVGRLKKAKFYYGGPTEYTYTENLKKLKRELQDFDARTGEWKKKT